MSNTNAVLILSTLSAESVGVLRTHFLAEAAATLTSSVNGHASTPSTPRVHETSKRRGPGKRQITNDGTERSASQFIRDCKDTMSANEVVDAGKEVGLEIAPALVYNVRNQAAKKAEAAADETAKVATNKKRAAALKKARAAKAAKATAAK